MATADIHTIEQINSGVTTPLEQKQLQIIKDSRHTKISLVQIIGL